MKLNEFFTMLGEYNYGWVDPSRPDAAGVRGHGAPVNFDQNRMSTDWPYEGDTGKPPAEEAMGVPFNVAMSSRGTSGGGVTPGANGGWAHSPSVFGMKDENEVPEPPKNEGFSFTKDEGASDSSDEEGFDSGESEESGEEKAEEPEQEDSSEGSEGFEEGPQELDGYPNEPEKDEEPQESDEPEFGEESEEGGEDEDEGGFAIHAMFGDEDEPEQDKPGEDAPHMGSLLDLLPGPDMQFSSGDDQGFGAGMGDEPPPQQGPLNPYPPPVEPLDNPGQDHFGDASDEMIEPQGLLPGGAPDPMIDVDVNGGNETVTNPLDLFVRGSAWDNIELVLRGSKAPVAKPNPAKPVDRK